MLKRDYILLGKANNDDEVEDILINKVPDYFDKQLAIEAKYKLTGRTYDMFKWLCELKIEHREGYIADVIIPDDMEVMDLSFIARLTAEIGAEGYEIINIRGGKNVRYGIERKHTLIQFVEPRIRSINIMVDSSACLSCLLDSIDIHNSRLSRTEVNISCKEELITPDIALKIVRTKCECINSSGWFKRIYCSGLSQLIDDTMNSHPDYGAAVEGEERRKFKGRSAELLKYAEKLKEAGIAYTRYDSKIVRDITVEFMRCSNSSLLRSVKNTYESPWNHEVDCLKHADGDILDRVMEFKKAMTKQAVCLGYITADFGGYRLKIGIYECEFGIYVGVSDREESFLYYIGESTQEDIYNFVHKIFNKDFVVLRLDILIDGIKKAAGK